MEFKLIDSEAESKERARVEVKEIRQVEKTFTTSKEIIVNTIEMLESRKAKLVAEIDAEIAYNQTLLNEVAKAVDKVAIRDIEK